MVTPHVSLKRIHFPCPWRRDQNLLSPVNCWYLLLNQVRRESKDHATLSDIYLNNVIMRFMQISEDSTRLLKKVGVTRRHLKHHHSIICIFFQRGQSLVLHSHKTASLLINQFDIEARIYVQHRFRFLVLLSSEILAREVPNAYASTLPFYDCGFLAESCPLLAFPPQGRQLPGRLWAALQQETHELTTGLNYNVAFLQRGAFVSAWLVWLFDFLILHLWVPHYCKPWTFNPIQKAEARHFICPESIYRLAFDSPEYTEEQLFKFDAQRAHGTLQLRVFSVFQSISF